MVINQIDIPNMSITKPKYHAPVRSNRDAPETFEPAFERVKPEAGKIHIQRNPQAWSRLWVFKSSFQLPRRFRL
jgi:hypothetical protein